MLFCYYLINISKMNTSSDNEKESQEVLLTSNMQYTMIRMRKWARFLVPAISQTNYHNQVENEENRGFKPVLPLVIRMKHFSLVMVDQKSADLLIQFLDHRNVIWRNVKRKRKHFLQWHKLKKLLKIQQKFKDSCAVNAVKIMQLHLT